MKIRQILVVLPTGIIARLCHLRAPYPDCIQQIPERKVATLDGRIDHRPIRRLSGYLPFVSSQTSKVLGIACTQGSALQPAGKAGEPLVSQAIHQAQG